MATLIYCSTCGKQISSNAKSCPHCGELSKKTSLLSNKVYGVFWGVIILIAIISTVKSVNNPQLHVAPVIEEAATAPLTEIVNEAPNVPQVPSDPFTELENESPSDLVPQGELANMFNLGSDNTDLQRENKLKEITGKIVQWQLPVYEISKSDDEYKVQTSGGDVVGTFIYITTRNDQDKQIIEALKTGDTISFKGRIYDTSVRYLEIKPAILFSPIKPEKKAPIDSQSVSSQVAEIDEAEAEEASAEESAAQYKAREASTEDDTQETVKAEKGQKPKVEGTTWLGNWGSGIEAKVTSDHCTDSDFLKQGYTYFASSSIPEARLKKAKDAYFVSGGRATTTIGCWFKKQGGFIHMKMKRKHDGKIWEFDHDVYNASVWASVTDESENSRSKYVLDEANNRINAVWKATTKDIRKALLPGQKAWLKQRENDCPLKSAEEYAIRLNCMVAMTDKRTEVLKQKISTMENN